MKKTFTQRIVLSGLFVALGVLFPLFTGHAMGVPGTVLLPMHIPIFLAGLLCGWQFGFICGIVTPVLSSLMTGMPPTFPMLPIMMAELATYGLVSGLVYKIFDKSPYPAMLAAMVVGRGVYGVTFAILFTMFGPLKALTVGAAIVTGLPGIALQLVVVPLIVIAITRVTKHSDVKNAILRELKQDIRIDENNTCFVVKNQQIVFSGKGRGVKPLIHLLENQPETLKNAFVLDKVIGKAAATILVLGGAKKVYGEIMSNGAIELFKKHNISFSFGKNVYSILNRAEDDTCPLEKAVSKSDDLNENLQQIKSTIVLLMSGKA